MQPVDRVAGSSQRGQERDHGNRVEKHRYLAGVFGEQVERERPHSEPGDQPPADAVKGWPAGP